MKSSGAQTEPDWAAVLAAERAFCEFNAHRCLADSAFEWHRIAGVWGCRDLRRRDGRDAHYYQRLTSPLSGALSSEALEEACRWYESVGLTPAVMLAGEDHADAALLSRLAARGFVLHSTMALLGCSDHPDPSAPVRWPVEPVGEGDLRAYFDAVASSGPEIAARLTEAERARRSSYLLASEFPQFAVRAPNGSDELAATASVFAHHGVAWLGNAYVRPQWRGQGMQTALLQQRLLHARQHGWHTAVVDTDFGSQSYRNCLRAGFQLFGWLSFFTRSPLRSRPRP